MSLDTQSASRSSRHSSEGCFYSPYASEDDADIFEPCPPDAETRAAALASELHSLQLDEYRCAATVTRATVESPASPAAELIGSRPVSKISISHPVDSPSQLARWMAFLRRRGAERHKLRCSSNPRPKAIHRPSSSGSSFAFITAVRSATVSLSNMSIVTRPSPPSDRSPTISGPGCSGKNSVTGHRSSEDSVALARSMPDLSALERSIHRRRNLEEIIRTEEAYIGDVRFLNNIYVTIFAALPGIDSGIHACICQNLAEIVELHDEILGELHRTIPHSEYSQVDINLTLDAFPRPSSHSHHRWMSAESCSPPQGSASWFKRIPGMLVEPQVAAEVARIFRKRVHRFFVYKEYGAQYHRMLDEVSSANTDNPKWPTYRKGLEALASIVGSMQNQKAQPKRAAAVEDLLIKPIQRVCRYPILFTELLKNTPAKDCPNSRMEVEGTLLRMQEAATAINEATGDKDMRAILETTWRLQDRLAYHTRELDATSKNYIRSFGHIRLCGVLHICWQTNSGVEGKYMICLLYKDVLCLALGVKMDMIYDIHACINLNRTRMEKVDDGRGLQCHTAPFSWKLMFEYEYFMYEIIMTACTEKEQAEWESRLRREPKDADDTKRMDPVCFLALGVKAVGPTFGKQEPAARAAFMHRATTVGPKSTQVILKNTSLSQRESKATGEESAVNRSQSLLTTHRMPVLSPSRSERTQLESVIADVWSHNVLPFPGMPRANLSVRETVMRKFSVASITSTLSKRSGSRKKRIRSAEHAPWTRPAVTRRSKSTMVSEDTQSDPEDVRSNKIRRRHTDAGLKDDAVDFDVLREFGMLQRSQDAWRLGKRNAEGSDAAALALADAEVEGLKGRLPSRNRWMRGSGAGRDCSSRSLRGLFG